MEPVPHARFREQVLRTRRVVLELAPQVLHVLPQVVGLLDVRRPPHLLQQLALAHEPAGVAEQQVEQLPLGRRQVHGVPGPVRGAALGDRPAGQVDGPPAQHDRLTRLLRAEAPAHRPDPGEQLLDAERLRHVVVGAGVQGVDLRRAVHPAGEDDDRHRRPAAQRADHVDAVHVRQAEVEDDEVRVVGRGGTQRLRPGGRRRDAVLPGEEVDPQRPQDLGLVVDDEHARHRAASARPAPRSPGRRSPGRRAPGTPLSGAAGGGGAAGRLMVIVNPPPGVASGTSVPPMASTSPRDSASPRPTPTVLSRSPSRWNGRKIRSQSSRGTPGPTSTTRSSTRPPSELAVTVGGTSGGLNRRALTTRLASARSSSAGSATTSGTSSGTRMATARAGGPIVSTADGTTSATSMGCRSRASAPAWSRLMSRRFSTRPRSRSSDSSAVASSSARSSSSKWTSALRRLLTAAVADASGVRRSWLTALSSAVRSRSTSASAPAVSAWAASRSCRSATAACAAKASTTRWSAASSG